MGACEKDVRQEYGMMHYIQPRMIRWHRHLGLSLAFDFVFRWAGTISWLIENSYHNIRFVIVTEIVWFIYVTLLLWIWSLSSQSVSTWRHLRIRLWPTEFQYSHFSHPFIHAHKNEEELPSISIWINTHFIRVYNIHGCIHQKFHPSANNVKYTFFAVTQIIIFYRFSALTSRIIYIKQFFNVNSVDFYLFDLKRNERWVRATNLHSKSSLQMH